MARSLEVSHQLGPVLFKVYLVKLGPGEDEAELSATEVTVDYLEVVDPDLGFAFSVTGMEVREAMIIEEHRDRDPEEAAYRRHESIMAPAPAVVLLGLRFGFRSQIRSLASLRAPNFVLRRCQFELARRTCGSR
jgi:hypothetical protein